MFELIFECGLIIISVAVLCLLAYLSYCWFSGAATDCSIDPVRFERLRNKRSNRMQRRVRILKWLNVKLGK